MGKSALPDHVGFIPDGNRRWAKSHGLAKEAGYRSGIQPGVQLFEQCTLLGIPEISIFCFTQDNTKRPSVQTDAFVEATVAFALEMMTRGAALMIVGDATSKHFPKDWSPSWCARVRA
jgi:undecaprenyl diphosphate synthase